HEHLPVIRKQLGRAGLPVSALDAAAQVVSHTLCATLASEKGRWLLNAAKAQREWSLLDVSGRVSVIDLAIADEEGWLVVDYKTSMPPATEDPEQFAARMRLRHGEQLKRYCEQVAALDGRPARAALYFPRADIWLEFGRVERLLLNFVVAGPFACSGGNPSQVGNEAPLVAKGQSRSQARRPIFSGSTPPPQAVQNPVHFSSVLRLPSGTGLPA